jgi:hypothetical protein
MISIALNFFQGLYKKCAPTYIHFFHYRTIFQGTKYCGSINYESSSQHFHSRRKLHSHGADLGLTGFTGGVRVQLGHEGPVVEEGEPVDEVEAEEEDGEEEEEEDVQPGVRRLLPLLLAL